MPTVFYIKGYRFMFYSDDHEPIHVHVEKDNCIAKYNVEPLEQVNCKGFKKQEIKEIEDIVAEKKDVIIKIWNSIFKK